MTYDIIKKNFDKKLWTVQMVKVAVAKGIITAEQFKLITNQTYTV